RWRKKSAQMIIKSDLEVKPSGLPFKDDCEKSIFRL
ncbi:MAG: hypothetical protein Harvfovirus53_1, partial [Harvfovirus sp.]